MRFFHSVLVLALILASVSMIFGHPGHSNQNKRRSCKVASDCVPATCCHAKDVVNKAFAPDCSDAFCTVECQYPSLDCGQADINCLDNTCTIVYKKTN